MIGRNEPALRSPNPKVFVNPIFEIKKGFDMPANKTELVEYLLRGVVVPFHKNICQTCHKIPEFQKWQQEDLNSSKLYQVQLARTAILAHGNGPNKWDDLKYGHFYSRVIECQFHTWKGKTYLNSWS